MGRPPRLAWDRIERRSLTLDGDRIVYRVAGEGPVLLLVHGLAGSAMTWRHVMAPLAERFTVIAPDLLGQGESDRPRGEYSLDAHVDTLCDLMDALGHERATVVGQSLGGGVVMQLAYQHPERCERMVLVDSGGFGREVTAFLRLLSLPAAEALFPLVCTPRVRALAGRIAPWLGRKRFRTAAAREEMWRSYASLADADRRRAFFRSLRDVIEPGGQALSALGRLHHAAGIPTLIVWGAEDPFIPVRHAYEAHAAIPGSRLVIFEGVGHYPHCEAPARFVETLVDFIASTDAARLPPRWLRRQG